MLVHPTHPSRLLVSFILVALAGLQAGCGTRGNDFAPAQFQGTEENTAQVRQPMPHCVVEIAGVGDPGQGWVALRKDSSLWRNPYGADPSTHPSAERDPFFHDNVLRLADIDGEALSSCAITSDNRLWCWGANDRGQLGDGTKRERPDPVEVKALGPHVVQVGISHTYACALKDDGTVWCWGGNDMGQLGTGDTVDSLVPKQVPIGTDNEYVSVGFEHVCVKKTNGDLWCWGENGYGEVGVGNSNNPHLQPTKVMTNVKKISAGGFFTCAIKTDDTLWCWGDNADGHVGVGDQVNHLVPTQVTTLGNNVLDVDASVRAACAVTKDGAVWCWGWPERGRLGDGRNDPNGAVTLPQRVNGPLGHGGAKRVYCREVSACAVTTDDELYCWGAGIFLDGKGMQLVPTKIDFCSLPDLRKLSPTQGPSKGGGKVTLTGTDFQDGAKVLFDGKEAASVNVVSPTKVEAVAPEHEPGTVDVVLVNPGNHPARLRQAYTYVLGPTFDNVSPQRGPLTGGTDFVLSGSGFSSHAKVELGGKEATDVQVVDETTIKGKTPAVNQPGPVDIVVTNDDGQKATGKGAFVYVGPPGLTKIEPDSGPSEGGQQVTLHGSGFTWDTIVRFGDAQASGEPQDEHTLVVSTPAHAPGTVDITVEDQYGQKTTLSSAYTYLPGGGNGNGGQGGGAGSPNHAFEPDGRGGDVPFGVWSCAVGTFSRGEAPMRPSNWAWLLGLLALLSRRSKHGSRNR